MAGFDEPQVSVGKLAGFNMWDTKLDADSIMKLSCYDEGNIVNWNTLKEQGSSTRHYESFPCYCKSELYIKR